MSRRTRPRPALLTIRKVWADLTAHPRASVTEIAERLGMKSQSTVALSIRILEEASYVSRCQGGRARAVLVPFIVPTIRPVRVYRVRRQKRVAKAAA